jgi:hypothetical protein
MRRVKAIVVEYKDGIEVGHRKYKSLEKAWMDAERKNTTDPLCLAKHHYFKVVEVKRKKDAMDYIA